MRAMDSCAALRRLPRGPSTSVWGDGFGFDALPAAAACARKSAWNDVMPTRFVAMRAQNGALRRGGAPFAALCACGRGGEGSAGAWVRRTPGKNPHRVIAIATDICARQPASHTSYASQRGAAQAPVVGRPLPTVGHFGVGDPPLIP